MRSTTPILEVIDLHKSFPRVKAVDGVSFQIQPGVCFGLLGPNGAGKTTTIEIMEGITEPTSGRLMFQGKPVDRSFRERCGIQFQSTSLPDSLTVIEVLKLFKSLYKDQGASLDEIIAFCDLKEFLDRDTKKLSGGQRQRALLGLALVNNPDVLFLDEPTTGLDPEARRNFWDLVRKIKSQGKTLILTTHYMEEAYVLCDEIAIMNRGKIIAQGAPNSLLKEHFDEVLIEIPELDWVEPVHSIQYPFRHRKIEGLIELFTKDVNATLKVLLENQVNLKNTKMRPPSLDDLFLAVTAKARNLS